MYVVYPPTSIQAIQTIQVLPNQNRSPIHQFVFTPDPLTVLGNCTGVKIVQQPDYYEALTWCEQANKYHVIAQTPQGQIYLFKCKEKSNWCMRNLCLSSQREFDMDFYHIPSEVELSYKIYPNAFLTAYKPFKCTICCICRPEMVITLSDGKKILGTVKHIFTLCDPQFDIYDENNQLKYIVSGSCSQFGLLCARTSCSKMYEVEFNILSPDSPNVIGKIVRKAARNCGELVTDADNYTIMFPVNSSSFDRLLLISLGLMIDYQYFESDANKKA